MQESIVVATRGLRSPDVRRSVPGRGVARYLPRSRQFGLTSAPTIPHLVHTMRGPNDGTVRSPGKVLDIHHDLVPDDTDRE
jgi:hypothetical protein